MDSRAFLDRCGKSRLTGIRSPNRPARSHSLYQLSYPAHMYAIYVYFYVPMCVVFLCTEKLSKREIRTFILSCASNFHSYQQLYATPNSSHP